MPRKRPPSDRGRGRPYYGRALWERVALSWWIEKYAEQYRQAGNRRPYVQVAIDYLDLTEGPDFTEKCLVDGVIRFQ